ncbi:ribosome biogenesis GTPase Der [Marinibaculum pumilum]|uniref:GTPase Der n=1 Tax=Marinibaculum pumilum TaxID=1766165 RepID=A0ABV7KZ34_9PROT
MTPPERLLVAAIVGRPNVGKSTLFNRLAGRRIAIVADTPGVTRDRQEATASLGDLSFRVFDTAGLEEAAGDSTEARMRAQTDRAVADADVVLFLIDARAGVTPLDRHFGQALRATRKPVILLANKAEGRAGEAGVLEAYSLGLGEPVALSAEHGEGMVDLLDALLAHAPADADTAPSGDEGQDPGFSEEGSEGDDDEDAPAGPLQLAVVGRPNAGKSTLVNRLLGDERLLTGPEPGLTRDAISIDWSFEGQWIRLVDTAGMRRKARIEEDLERLSVRDSLDAVKMAQVVVLLIDGQRGLDRQDLTIAAHVAEEGRAMVLAVNKWDLVEDRARRLKEIEERLEISLTQVRGIPIVTLSALTGRHVDRLLPAVMQQYARWTRRLPTAQLNRFLAEAQELHPPPAVSGRRLRIRYATQVKARPPTFALFVNKPEELPDSYLRYLANGLRELFDLTGIPLRLMTRKGRNPYAPD